MKQLSSYKLFALFCLLTLTACEDFVEVDMPSSQLTSEGVFQSTSTANAAMANIYAGIRDNGLMNGSVTGISNLLGGYADELDYYGQTGTSMEFFFANTVLASDIQVNTLWSVSYSQIYAANAVIEGVGSSSTIPQSEKDRLKGEALFLRAWLHFYLANIYGDVPYVTSTNYSVNANVARLPLTDVYNKIITDLEQAVTLLPENDLTFNRTKPNRWAAQAFLSRVFLYSGEWTEASDAASTILNDSALFSLNPNLNDVFLNTSTETIWQLQPIATNANTLEAAAFIFLTGPPPNMALTPGFMEAFETNDGRRISWTNAVSDGNQTWHHAYKYKRQGTSASSQESSIMLRVAELYLIRAEARARQGDLVGAKEDLNAIRLRAGLLETTAVSQQQILDAVLQERRIELFTELGHRFFDLKRFAAANAVLSVVKPNWDSTDALLPIPETELLSNPNLGSQNPGY
jgi:hypothetical protein